MPSDSSSSLSFLAALTGLDGPLLVDDGTLQVRNDRNLSRTLTFDAAEGQVVAYRCTGKRFLPIFLVSFVVPRLALSLLPESQGLSESKSS